jgi:hypothetical protein
MKQILHTVYWRTPWDWSRDGSAGNWPLEEEGKWPMEVFLSLAAWNHGVNMIKLAELSRQICGLEA